MSTRLSDWYCPKCKFLVFDSKSNCSKCGITRFEASVTRTSEPQSQEEKHRLDWYCSTCDAIIWANKPRCRKCGANRPEQLFHSAHKIKTAADKPTVMGHVIGLSLDLYECAWSLSRYCVTSGFALLTARSSDIFSPNKDEILVENYCKHSNLVPSKFDIDCGKYYALTEQQRQDASYCPFTECEHGFTRAMCFKCS